MSMNIELENLVDKLGLLRSQKKEIDLKVKDIESVLKSSTINNIDGKLFSVTISSFEQSRTDWKTICSKLTPSRQLVTAWTKSANVVRLTIKAHKKS